MTILNAESRSQPAALTEKGQSGSRAQPADAAEGMHRPAKGKIVESRDGGGVVVFNPRGTNYEMHLDVAGGYGGPLKKPVGGVVRVKARKVYTVPSGGNFVVPILGQPRIIQGRVMAVSETQIVVHAGGPVLVDLPDDGHAVDLANGPVAEGSIVNVVAFPGASFEPAADAA